MAIKVVLFCFILHLVLMSLCGTTISFSLPSPNLRSKDLLKFLLSGPTTSDVRLSALFVFGDSWIANKNGADGIYYGVDFHVKNNIEYSNGRSIADFIAQLGGFPPVPNEYNKNDIRNGVNYASSGCGIFPRTKPQGGQCISLDEQINHFQKTVDGDIKSQFNSNNSLASYFSESLFLIIAGNNDFSSNQDPSTYSYSSEKYAEILLARLSTQLQQLYNIGARKFLVGNINPIGCQPRKRRYTDLTCSEDDNYKISYYNKILPQTLQDLESRLSGSMFTFLDVNKVFQDVFASPTSYGITNTTSKCYNQFMLELCEDRKQYVWFDSIHPTEIMYFLIFNRCLNDSSICTPRNLLQLLQVK